MEGEGVGSSGLSPLFSSQPAVLQLLAVQGPQGLEQRGIPRAQPWAGQGVAEEGALSACAPPWVCVWVLCTVLLWDMVIG